MNLKGLGVAVITPFDSNLNVDYKSLEKIVDYLISNGTDYLVMLGTTGESVTLTKEEKLIIIDTAKSVNNNRIPIIVGIGGNNTIEVINSLKSFDPQGIDGILSVSPYYNKPNQEGIYHHYKSLSENSPLPIILYNVPGRTGSNISVETTLRLANDFENIVAIKEASGNIDQIMQIIKHKPKGFSVISGDDALTLSLLPIGIDGVISVIGNAFPKEFSSMMTYFWNNNYKTSQELHYQLLDFINLCFADGSPSGIKGLMHLKGLCDVYVRQPLFPIKDIYLKKFKSLLTQ